MYMSSSISFRSHLRIRRLLSKYYTPAQLDQQQKHTTPIFGFFCLIQRVRVME